jgi:hypothetical protein
MVFMTTINPSQGRQNDTFQKQGIPIFVCPSPRLGGQPIAIPRSLCTVFSAIGIWCVLVTSRQRRLCCCLYEGFEGFSVTASELMHTCLFVCSTNRRRKTDCIAVVTVPAQAMYHVSWGHPMRKYCMKR